MSLLKIKLKLRIDTCSSIASDFGITLTEFYAWNPAVGSSCANLWLSYYACIGVSGITSTPASTTVPTTPVTTTATSSLSTSTATLPSTTSTTASPTTSNPSVPCTTGAWQCNGNVMEECLSGNWAPQVTCGAGLTCQGGDEPYCGPSTNTATLPSTTSTTASPTTSNPSAPCATGAWQCNGNVMEECLSGNWAPQVTCGAGLTCQGGDEPYCGTA